MVKMIRPKMVKDIGFSTLAFLGFTSFKLKKKPIIIKRVSNVLTIIENQKILQNTKVS